MSHIHNWNANTKKLEANTKKLELRNVPPFLYGSDVVRPNTEQT